MNFVIIISIAVILIAVYVERYDKGHIRKNIRKKQDKIKELEHRKLIKYNYQLNFPTLGNAKQLAGSQHFE